jgi:hypothetical protein
MFTVINDHVTYNIKAHNIFIVYLQKEFTVPRTIHTPTFIHHLQLKGNLMQINAAIKTLWKREKDQGHHKNHPR